MLRKCVVVIAVLMVVFLRVFFCAPLYGIIQVQPIVIIPATLKFFAPQPTVSKFPPVVEFVAQRVQSLFSNYVYEDLSRPPTWDKPVYTLPPDFEQNISAILSMTTGFNKVTSTTPSMDAATATIAPPHDGNSNSMTTSTNNKTDPSNPSAHKRPSTANEEDFIEMTDFTGDNLFYTMEDLLV